MILDSDKLQDFELTIDTRNPENNQIPIEILGYGEISLVFRIVDDPAGSIAYKRLPIFDNEDQVNSHIEAYHNYNKYLQDVGIKLPSFGASWVYSNEKKKGITLFCAQETVPENAVCNRLIHTRNNEEILKMVANILEELAKIWKFNESSPDIKLGFDGQISNFAEINGELIYLDTSTPMYRINGKDAMNAKLFLKSAPPGIRFLLKIFFLSEVLDRYYVFREVLIDLLANFYKEQRDDLIPELIPLVNSFLENKVTSLNITPITEKEVKSYYKSDKFIWTLFIRMRYMHRFITTKILRRKYPFYLPGKIDR